MAQKVKIELSLSDDMVDELLEKLVDKLGITVVLESLATTAYAKASHIQESYNDRQLTRMWDKTGDRIVTAINGIDKIMGANK